MKIFEVQHMKLHRTYNDENLPSTPLFESTKYKTHALVVIINNFTFYSNYELTKL